MLVNSARIHSVYFSSPLFSAFVEFFISCARASYRHTQMHSTFLHSHPPPISKMTSKTACLPECVCVGVLARVSHLLHHPCALRLCEYCFVRSHSKHTVPSNCVSACVCVRATFTGRWRRFQKKRKEKQTQRKTTCRYSQSRTAAAAVHTTTTS